MQLLFSDKAKIGKQYLHSNRYTHFPNQLLAEAMNESRKATLPKTVEMSTLIHIQL